MKIHHNFPLSDVLYYKIGGKARYLLEATNKQEISDAFTFLRERNIQKYLVTGLGANLLVSDDFFDGAVILVTDGKESDFHLREDGFVTAYAGGRLEDLIQFSFAHGYTGLEALGGLPSTVGGAIRGNAGAFGTETSDVVETVEVLDSTRSDNGVKELKKDESAFSYRNSIFKQNPHLIILQATLKFKKSSPMEIEEAKKVYEDKVNFRKTRHPVEYPSCGSVFQNIRKPEQVEKILSVWPDIEEQVKNKWYGKVSMGYVNTRLGFSGMQVGGAKITEKHSNYICNVDHASFDDVYTIINSIVEKFKETFGFPPEVEVQIVK